MMRDILIVEDDDDLAEVMEAALADSGYAVRRASDGLDALSKVEEAMPALILLDMSMPRMDGWEFAKVFRTRHTASVPIVVVTAAEHARRRATEICANDVLSKPFSLDALDAVVAKHLCRP